MMGVFSSCVLGALWVCGAEDDGEKSKGHTETWPLLKKGHQERKQ